MRINQFLFLLPLLTLSCLLSSCSTSSDHKQAIPMENDDGVLIESATIEAEPTREAVYVYNQTAGVNDRERVLNLNAEPLLVNSSYLRLVGVVWGQGPIAVIEVSGKGLCLGVGEEVAGYKIASVSERKVKLIKR